MVEIDTQVESPSELNPAEQKIRKARQFFSVLGIPFDEDGLVALDLAESQLKKLVEYREHSFQDSIEMPTEEDFFRKVLVAVSLWRQKKGGNIEYLLGKGAGVEIALQGIVQSRQATETAITYRTHSDFELYSVANTDSAAVYPENFKRVFGAQEIFPPSRTKALSSIPEGYLEQTAETVNFGGIEVLIPELEILFLDKWLLSGVHNRPEGTDAEVLAKKYPLNKEKVHDYLERFYVGPAIEALPRVESELEFQLGAIKRNYASLKGSKDVFSRSGDLHQLVTMELNDRIQLLIDDDYMVKSALEGIKYSGIRVKYWCTISPENINQDGIITDSQLLEQIINKIETKLQRMKDYYQSKHKQVDILLN